MKKNFDLKPNNLRVNQLGYLDKCKSGLLIVNYPKGITIKIKQILMEVLTLIQLMERL